MEAYFGYKFELIEVSDIITPDVFDRILKDFDGIAHIVMHTDVSPHVVDETVKINLQLLDAAATEQGVKTCALLLTYKINPSPRITQPLNQQLRSRF